MMGTIYMPAGPGFRITVQDHGQVVRLLSDIRPDPTWSEVDANGHRHAWVGDTVPTALLMTEPDFVIDEGTEEEPMLEEYPGAQWWECSTCGEEISPATVDLGPSERWMSGRTEYTLDFPDHPPVALTKDEYDRLCALDGDEAERYALELAGLGHRLA